MGSVHWCCRATGMCLENLLPTSSPVVESLLVSERGLGGAADDPSARSLCEASVHPSSRPYVWQLPLPGNCSSLVLLTGDAVKSCDLGSASAAFVSELNGLRCQCRIITMGQTIISQTHVVRSSICRAECQDLNGTANPIADHFHKTITNLEACPSTTSKVSHCKSTDNELHIYLLFTVLLLILVGITNMYGRYLKVAIILRVARSRSMIGPHSWCT